MTEREVLKLALEALEYIHEGANNQGPHTGISWRCVSNKAESAITALREALAEQETVLPGGGHVPAVPVAVYGYCPECGGAGVMRERRPNGDDKCTNGHKYPSSKALAEQPAQQEGCQCPACQVLPHASDCAVHNVPAYPKGKCDCGVQQEPVAITITGKLGNIYSFTGDYSLKKGDKVYTTPPQRKPLTDEEIILIVAECAASHQHTDIHFARAIEAAHGIKE